jgi:uncharacterized phage protein (TIGR02218 family)
MTFSQFEISNHDSIPSLLYEFRLQGRSWLYCSDERDVTTGGKTYLSAAISDSGIVQSGDVQNDDFTITMPATLAFASLFIGTPPSDTIGVVVRRVNRGDSEAPIVWVGEVKSTKRTGLGSLNVICKPSTATLNRNGLRLAYTRGCPHALYDINCTVDKSLHGAAVQITYLDGENISATGIGAQGDGFWSGGFVEWQIMTGVTERRAVEDHSGPTVRLMGSTDGLSVGQWIAIYPGCDRTSPTCINKFANLSNYGGFPAMPEKSPFDGDPIF